MLTDHKKDFSKLFRGLCRSRQPWQVFADFCEAATLSIANAVAFSDEREKRYMAIVERDRESIKEFPKLLGLVVEALEVEPQDFLGVVFQELELANHWHGQFFTPFHLARLMAAFVVS